MNEKFSPSKSNFNKIFGEMEGEEDANKVLTCAERRANAKAATLLAAQVCPSDVKKFGARHNIEKFAEYTWMAGFNAGMRAAILNTKDENDGPYEKV